MKKLLFVFVLIMPFVYSQEGDRSGGVELPTFVITGKDVVELPTVNKVDVQITPKLPESNFNPVFKPIKFSRREFKPAFKELEMPVYNFSPQFRGEAALGFGNIVSPSVNADLMYLTRELTANARVTGYNSRAFVDNSESFLNSVYGRINYYPFSGKGLLSDVFLSGGIITNYRKYKLYGYIIPLLERNLKTYDIDINFQKGKDTPYFLNIIAENRSTVVKEESFNSNLTLLGGEMGFHFTNFRLDVEGKLFINKETHFSSVVNNQVVLLRGSASVIISDLLSISGGAQISRNSAEAKLSPVSSFKFRFYKGLELGASYSGGHNFHNNAELIRYNRYINNFAVSDLSSFTEKNISIYIKYEAEKTLSLLLSANDIGEKNYLFVDYNDSLRQFLPGVTDIRGKIFSLQTSVHLGIFGSVHNKSVINFYDKTNGGEVPGVIPFISDLEYTVVPLKGMETMLGFTYKAPHFYTSRDLSKINGYYTISLGAKYSISDAFTLIAKVSNLSDNKIYNFYNYTEPGRNIEAGFSFNW